MADIKTRDVCCTSLCVWQLQKCAACHALMHGALVAPPPVVTPVGIDVGRTVTFIFAEARH